MINDPGNIILGNGKDLYSRKNKSLKFSINVKNDSKFEEVININVDKSIGKLKTKEYKLEANTSKKIDVVIKLNNNLNPGNYKYSLKFKPNNELTTISDNEIQYNLVILTFFDNLKLSNVFRKLISKSLRSHNC